MLGRGEEADGKKRRSAEVGVTHAERRGRKRRDGKKKQKTGKS